MSRKGLHQDTIKAYEVCAQPTMCCLRIVLDAGDFKD